MSSKLKKAAAFSAVIGLTFTIGIAFAAWTANGTGTGYAKARGKLGLTTAQVTPAGDLYPGATGAVVVKINNPNPYPVSIATISKDGAAALPCSVTFTNQSGLSLYVPANGSDTFTLPNAVAMGADAADSCAETTIAIPITFTGSSTSPATAAPSVGLIAEPVTNQPTAVATFASTQGLGQSITRSVAGTVSGAAVFIESGPAVSGSATVKVWNLDNNGAPTTAISTDVVNGLTPTPGQWLQVNLPAPVAVPARFGITLTPSWGDATLYAQRSTTDVYAGGSLLIPNGTQALVSSSADLKIRIYGS